MMLLPKQSYFLLLSMVLPLCLLVSGTAAAQGATADTAFVQRSVQHAVDTYTKSLGAQTHLYNGTEYVNYVAPYFEGDQYFHLNAATAGSVFYDGTWYEKVPMLYDIVRDELIIPYNTTGMLMKLIREKVDTFQVHNHTYVRLQPDSAGAIALEPGFYDLLHSGDVQLLVKRRKTMQEKATPDGVEGEFRSSDKYYIRKDGTYHQVRTKGSVYKLLADKKKQLRAYASEQKLKFRKDRENAILALVNYYDNLPATPPQNSAN